MTAKIKLNAASGGGSFSLQAPSSSSNNRVITLPDIADGTLLTNQSTISGTITQADQWRTTSYFNVGSTKTLVDSNWERNDTDFALIGSGMTVSSGVFTFPATGIYLIDFTLEWYRSAAQAIDYVASNIETTTDNSNFNLRGLGYGNLPNDAGVHSTISHNIIFDVTNTSTHKVRFQVQAEDTVTFLGDTNRNQTCATFIRLGDT